MIVLISIDGFSIEDNLKILFALNKVSKVSFCVVYYCKIITCTINIRWHSINNDIL